MSEVASPVKVKNAPVSGPVFLDGYRAGNKAGKTNKEIAESLGMSLATFNVRLSQARKKFAELHAAGKIAVNPLDGLKTNRKSGSSSLVEYANKLVSDLDAVDSETLVVNDVQATVETPEGETVSA